jgi:hypothetical protein
MSHQLAMASARDHIRAEARLELAEAMLRIIADMEAAEHPSRYVLEMAKQHLDTVVTTETRWLSDE